MLAVLLYGLFYGVMISLPIGPANIELLRRGLHQDFNSAFKVGIGAALSDALLCILVYFGVVKIIMGSKFINSCLGLVCSGLMIYLGYSGFMTIFTGKKDTMQIVKAHGSRRDPILMGFTINTSNPMVIGFWVVFLGAISSYSSIKQYFHLYPRGGVLIFAFAVFMGSVAWFYTLCHIVNRSKKYITNSLFELISFICSSLFMLFGIMLIYGVIKMLLFS